MVLIWVELTRGTPKIGTNLEKLTREGADAVGTNLERDNPGKPKQLELTWEELTRGSRLME